MTMRDPKTLSKRAVAVLALLYESEAGEIVCDGLDCWVGLERTSRRVVDQWLECCFVRPDDFSGGAARFRINESGERFLKGLPPYRDAEGWFHETVFDLLAERRPRGDAS